MIIGKSMVSFLIRYFRILCLGCCRKIKLRGGDVEMLFLLMGLFIGGRVYLGFW